MNTCRICYDEEHKNNRLLAPCICKGSIAYIHQKCLRDWVRVSSSPYCELCKFPYVTEEVTLETLYEPSPNLLWISKHSFAVYFNTLIAYLLYLLYSLHIPGEATQWHIIITNIVNYMPFNLIAIMGMHAYIMIPAIRVVKQKRLYLQYVFSCRRLPTMRISVLTYLTILIIGFISSFYFITSSFMVAVFLEHIYKIHSQIILQINIDRLQNSIWFLEFK